MIKKLLKDPARALKFAALALLVFSVTLVLRDISRGGGPIIYRPDTGTVPAAAGIAAAPPAPTPQSQLIHRQFPGFELIVDCERRAPVLFQYLADKDTGNLPRVER